MKCPHCGARKTRVLDTRCFDKAEKYRKHACSCGATWNSAQRLLLGSLKLNGVRVADQKMPRDVPPGVRFEVLRRDGFACAYCGAQAPDVKLEVDHVVPVSKGGSSVSTNLRAACRDCNGGKGSSL